MRNLDQILAEMIVDTINDQGHEAAEEGFFDLVVSTCYTPDATKDEVIDFCRRQLGYVPQEVQHQL